MSYNNDLHNFVNGRVSPDSGRLARAYSKSGFAASRTMNVHRVEEMVATRDGRRIRFAARWICGGGSVDALPVVDPDAEGSRCKRCDDRLADMEFGLIVVYRCYDRAGELLYVGSTTTGASARIASHKKAEWWPLIGSSRTRLERFDHELQARAAELRAIRSEHPRFNVWGRRSA